ncbi:MAG TPA: hypothetical protein VLD19_03560, partial [Chitinophagaceae bacterium]|nr:hypothetical protein [Chitinophagaceae bacterium]
MLTTLSHLGHAQQEELTQAIQKIAAQTSAVSIYCFGHRITEKTEWSLFTRGQAAQDNIPISCYDLVLVMPDSDIRHKEKVEGITTRRMSQHTSFTYQAFTQLGFDNLLKNGSPFISKVCREGVLLYNTSHRPPLGTLVLPSGTFLTNAATLHWIKSINMAWRVYRMAERAAERNERWLVLSSLEEAACYVCVALIHLYTGHRQRMETLSLLLKYCDNFCGIRTRVFPCNTPEESQLLQYLEMTVMMEERDYKKCIPYHIVEILLKRVGKMLELAEWMHGEKMRGSSQKESTLAHARTLRQAQGDSSRAW